MSVNRLFHLLNETNKSCPDFKGQNYRASFHTRSSAKGPRKKTYRAHLDGEGPRKGEHAVVKVFRHAPGTESMCDTEIAKHVLARKFARKFNKMVFESRDMINFTLPLKSTVERFGMGTYLFRHSRNLDKQEWVLIEENLVHDTDSEFEVFLKKNGERPKKDPSSLDAFLHFSYMESGEKFVLCGFQGIHSEDGYKLTTPCFHSTEKRWGLPDKGHGGMTSVFNRHRCNNLCYSWPKPSHHLGVRGGSDPSASSENETDEEATRVDSTIALSVRSTPGSRTNIVQGGETNGTRVHPQQTNPPIDNQHAVVRLDKTDNSTVQLDNSTVQSDKTDNSTVQSDRTDNSTVQSDKTDNSTVQSDKTDDTLVQVNRKNNSLPDINTLVLADERKDTLVKMKKTNNFVLKVDGPSNMVVCPGVVETQSD